MVENAPRQSSSEYYLGTIMLWIPDDNDDSNFVMHAEGISM